MPPIYTHDASCYMDEVYGIIGMCFLKNDDKTVGEETSKFKGTSWIVVPTMQALSKTPLRRLMTQHFTRFFKNSTGDSPSQYQKRSSGA